MQQRTRRSSPRRPSLTRRLFSTKRSWLPIFAPLGCFLRPHNRLLPSPPASSYWPPCSSRPSSPGAPSLPCMPAASKNNEGILAPIRPPVVGATSTGMRLQATSETLLSSAFGFLSGTNAPVLERDHLPLAYRRSPAPSTTGPALGQIRCSSTPTSGTTLGILGAASNGQSSGTATVTYTDSSTQTFALTFSDWTLHAGEAQARCRRYHRRGHALSQYQVRHQTINTYLYDTQVTLNPAKTVHSLTLPTTVTGGALHVFAISVGTPPADLYNNNGLSNDAATNLANFDGSGNSYSESVLTGFGLVSGTTEPVLGIAFPWPKVVFGAKDNWVSAGQVIPLASPTGRAPGWVSWARPVTASPRARRP